MELSDAHFSNKDLFDHEGQVHLSIDHIPGHEQTSRVVTVTPKEAGEQKLAPAKYKYTLEKEGGKEHHGVSTNKPVQAEVQTKRDFILTSSWHAV